VSPTRPQTCYVAPPEFLHELTAGLQGVTAVRPPLILAAGPPQNAAWALDVWYDPVFLPIQSISDGARQLKLRGRFYALLSTGHHRRAALIQEQLHCPRIEPLRFPQKVQALPEISGWTLWDEKTILVSRQRWKPFPHGEITFVQDKKAPPNRAYLKLWEAFTLMGEYPGAGDTCLDLGASPGGWTWVLQNLGAQVIAVDKAALDPKIARLANVKFRKESAFALQPGDFKNIDWLFLDIICYPERLLQLIRKWRGSGRVCNIVATVKFQGPTDKNVINQFHGLENSNLIHLQNNKHELTWIWPARPGLNIVTAAA
jgi:23S rRNA (cytidine2498-2'-O)-methyltransferase